MLQKQVSDLQAQVKKLEQIAKLASAAQASSAPSAPEENAETAQLQTQVNTLNRQLTATKETADKRFTFVQKMYDIENKLKKELSDKDQQLSEKEKELTQAKQVANKRQQMVQKMLDVERKLKVKNDELAESQPTEEINQLNSQLAGKEEELNQLKQVGNKRQTMVQHMLGVETKLKAELVLLQVKLNQKNRALEQSNVDELQPQK